MPMTFAPFGVRMSQLVIYISQSNFG